MASEFFEKVYRVVRQIPEGRVTTYGHIARFVGAARSARVVGYAMNASHNDMSVPAHRVVNRVGVLTGKHFFGGSTLMQDLLESEGVRVVDDQIIEFQKHLWDPFEALDQEDYLEPLD
jgi:methylated-DNA-protein-cysteine methyltransferase-like protein